MGMRHKCTECVFLSLSLASASLLSPLPFSSLLFLSLCLHLERTSTSSCRLQVLCLPQPNRDNPSAKKRVTKFMYMQMPLLCLVSSKSTESQTGQLQNSCLAPSCHVIRWSGRMCSPQRGTVRGSHDIPTVTQVDRAYEWPKKMGTVHLVASSQCARVSTCTFLQSLLPHPSLPLSSIQDSLHVKRRDRFP